MNMSLRKGTTIAVIVDLMIDSNGMVHDFYKSKIGDNPSRDNFYNKITSLFQSI